MTYTSSKLAILAVLCLMAVGCQNSKIQQEREWKALTDTIANCSKKISNIVGVIQQSGTTTEANQESLLHDIDSLERQMKGAIRRCAERNKDNELGQYLRENYQEE